MFISWCSHLVLRPDFHFCASPLEHMTFRWSWTLLVRQTSLAVWSRSWQSVIGRLPAATTITQQFVLGQVCSLMIYAFDRHKSRITERKAQCLHRALSWISIIVKLCSFISKLHNANLNKLVDGLPIVKACFSYRRTPSRVREEQLHTWFPWLPLDVAVPCYDSLGDIVSVVWSQISGFMPVQVLGGENIAWRLVLFHNCKSEFFFPSLKVSVQWKCQVYSHK